ncbi:MAG: hypothetical protein BA873_04325 [Desulfobulbaceae bacterium C00003063]|nr:MAG: hypothetical protein BA873_04325 [Desulfobulbaceae bacterium C00003063]
MDRIEGLKADPKKQGKALVKKLAGFRSIHVAGRYRAVYKIDEQPAVAWVVAVGIRKEGNQKDIYQIAKKLLKSGLLDHQGIFSHDTTGNNVVRSDPIAFS